MTSARLHEETARRLKANARVVERAAAAGIRPDPKEKISDWAASNRVVPEGASARPGPWRNEVAPYLTEIMDRLSPDDPCGEVVCMKPSQSGGSAVAENWIGYIMHRAPGPAMYIQTTVQAAKDWKVEKLDPMIQATPVLSPLRGGTVLSQRSRSGEGSTTQRVRFRGGFLLLAGANSAATLRQHSIRYQIRDDFDGWTDDAEGEGSPDKLAEARIKTYKTFGLSKVFIVSSPLLKGSPTEKRYEASDRRRYYVACKHCASISDLDWEDVEKNDRAPWRCRVRCPVCGTEHSEADKEAMLAAANGACWIPTAPDAEGEVPPKSIAPADIGRWRYRDTGRPVPGYWITGFINAFDRWDIIAQAEADAGDDPDDVKVFVNTILGRTYEPKGDGPAWEVLSARREADWHRGEIPAGVLFLTLAVDVQADGLYWERVGWGPGKESWTIDHGFLPGATDVPLEGAWPKLDQIADTGPRLRGVRLADDLIGVDSGYNVDAVYAWVRRRHNALALKGVDGWAKLPIFRAETPEIKKSGLSAGRARRFGLKVWLVGTYGIKAALMVYLSRLPAEGRSEAPTGLCHFPADAEEEYFRHLVSEYVRTIDGKTGPTRVWERKGANHWLDCRVYNWALTHYAGLWAWDEARWDKRAAEWAQLASEGGDLFDPGRSAVPSAKPGDRRPAGPPKPDDGLKSLARLNQ